MRPLFQSTLLAQSAVAVMLLSLVAGLQPREGRTQDASHATLTGRVVGAETGEPLAGVNVYISETTLGNATNEDGSFHIEQVPLGTVTLVASMVGRQTVQATFKVEDPGQKVINLELEPKTLRQEEVEVTAEQPRTWKRRLAQFRNYFIGETENAGECEILNPEVLDFGFDAETKTLLATAREPLKIENRALGYRLTFRLTEFYGQGGKTARYAGPVRFAAMEPENPEQAEQWRENRRRAYRGSPRHFFKSLIEDNLLDEGFHLFHVEKPGMIKQVRQFFEISPDDVLMSGEHPFERIVRFKNALQVTYQDEADDRRRRDKQISWLALSPRADSAVVDLQGRLNAPYALTRYGHWSRSARVSNLLPQDYEPPL